ncbi:MAG: LytTR family transcriptional regulator DNA-binding domain-containing protein [Flavobacterium sp.]
MKNFTFVVIDDNQNNALTTKAKVESFQHMHFLAMAANYEDGLDIILEHNPDIVFLEINPQNKESKLSLTLINELYRYLTCIPKFFITSTNDAFCLEAFKYGVFDYFVNPLEIKDLRKSFFRLDKELENSISLKSLASDFVQKESQEIQEKTSAALQDEATNSSEIVLEKKGIQSNKIVNTEDSKQKPLIICVKSYGDYRYIDAKDIAYLQADNNSTDIHLNSGEMITAFKTLKHFESVMTYPFIRIHNSYIVNIDYISRIHTGNAVCHIKNTTTKLPFSKSYKENVDAIIATIASGNYLEI